jgi:hypothetical protein
LRFVATFGVAGSIRLCKRFFVLSLRRGLRGIVFARDF